MPRHMRGNAAIEGFVHFRFTSGAGAKTQGLQKILRLYGSVRSLIPLSMSTVPCGGSPFGVTSPCTMNRGGPVVTGCGYVIRDHRSWWPLRLRHPSETSPLHACPIRNLIWSS
ncbi:hypothetical protein MSKU15_0172 [Komagataeibacter diospyri]|nr:hypothetical protein MSKU15_0172 [Komagataeibacter diospyri]